MSDKPRLWFTVVEAAEQTGYRRDTVQELAREGKIEAELTTAGYLIYMPSLYQYMQEKGYGPHQPKERKDDNG